MRTATKKGLTMRASKSFLFIGVLALHFVVADRSWADRPHAVSERAQALPVVGDLADLPLISDLIEQFADRPRILRAEDTQPIVACNALGTWLVVWREPDPNTIQVGDQGGMSFDRERLSLARSTDGGITWSEQTTLVTTTLPRGVRVQSAGGSEWRIIWIVDHDDAPGAGAVEVRSSDDGVTWSEPAFVWRNEESWDLRFGRDGVGNGLGIWTARADEQDNGRTVWSASTTGRASAPQPMRINTLYDTYDQSRHFQDSHADLWTNGPNSWLASWHQIGANQAGGGRLYVQDVLLSRTTDGGESWSPPVSMNLAAHVNPELDGLRIVGDDAGHWVAIWNMTDEEFGRTGIELTRGDVLLSYSLDNGSTWTTSRRMNPDVSVYQARDFRPDVATNGQGAWIAVWQSRIQDFEINGIPIYDFDLLWARSTDNGVNWSQPRSLTEGQVASDQQACIASDGQGTWIAVWARHEVGLNGPGLDADIFAARSNDDGSTWSEPAPVNLDAATDYLPACGAGMCGAGMAPMLPLLFATLGAMKFPYVCGTRRTSRWRALDSQRRDPRD